jgi:hypothetical protein
MSKRRGDRAMDKHHELDHNLEDNDNFSKNLNIFAGRPKNPDSWFQKRLDQVRSQQQTAIRSKVVRLDREK